MKNIGYMLTAAVFLLAAPGLANAAGMTGNDQRTVYQDQCKAGEKWDPATKKCVKK